MSDKNDKKPKSLDDLSEDDAELFLKFLESDKIPDKDKGRPLTGAPQPIRKQEASQDISLDLHGMLLAEALAEVDNLLSKLAVTIKSEQKVRIITGKGRHSSAGEGVLVRGVYEHVRLRWAPYIKRIDSPPADDLIEGLPLRGHFDVVIMRR